MHIRNFLLFVSAICMSATATAADLSIFGLQISRPFTLPECSFKKISKSLNFYNENDQIQGACYRQFSDSDCGKGINPSEATVYIRWPRGHEPELVSGYDLRVSVINGNLERVVFSTLGAISQQRDMDALAEKFGQPKTTAKPIVQNVYGATSQAISAEWRIDDVVVLFDSTQNALGKGSVSIETDKSISARNAYIESLHASRQKL
jgi:hypothetical protein